MGKSKKCVVLTKKSWRNLFKPLYFRKYNFKEYQFIYKKKLNEKQKKFKNFMQKSPPDKH